MLMNNIINNLKLELHKLDELNKRQEEKIKLMNKNLVELEKEIKKKYPQENGRN